MARRMGQTERRGSVRPRGRAGQSADALPRGATPIRQKAGNRAKTDISDAMNAYPAFEKIRKNNQLALEA